jgi:hypothetical protein
MRSMCHNQLVAQTAYALQFAAADTAHLSRHGSRER